MTTDIDKTDPTVRGRIAEGFTEAVAHHQALGLHVMDATGERIVVSLDYREDFLGDPVASLWHTAVGTTAAGSACGLAVVLTLPGMESVATLDLRMDYLRPAVADAPLHAEAECYHVTLCVAFARATLYQDDRDWPTALCTTVFMRTGSRTPR